MAKAKKIDGNTWENCNFVARSIFFKDGNKFGKNPRFIVSIGFRDTCILPHLHVWDLGRHGSYEANGTLHVKVACCFGSGMMVISFFEVELPFSTTGVLFFFFYICFFFFPGVLFVSWVLLIIFIVCVYIYIYMYAVSYLAFLEVWFSCGRLILICWDET